MAIRPMPVYDKEADARTTATRYAVVVPGGRRRPSTRARLGRTSKCDDRVVVAYSGSGDRGRYDGIGSVARFYQESRTDLLT